MSISARLASRLDQAIEYASESASVAERGGEEDLRWEALLTLAGCYVVAGDRDRALALIDEALASCDDDHLRAKFQFQRGYVRMVSGALREAKFDFESALPVFEAHNDIPSILLTLQNLGQIGVSSGSLSEAERNLEDALRLAETIEDRAAYAGILHNLGLMASYRGDIPLALQRLTTSDRVTMELSGSEAPQHVARCEVLISAGLYKEALSLAMSIVERNRQLGDGEHLANALSVATRAALYAESPNVVELAAETVEMFRDQGRRVRLLEASLILAEARARSEGASEELLAIAREASEGLWDEGVTYVAAQADLLAARLARDIGDLSTERLMLERVTEVDTGPFETRMQARVAEVRLALSLGDKTRAARLARAGLGLLDKYQSALGASDLRLGIERHGAELSRIGLGLAIDSKRPRRIMQWLDATRARALRYRPVTSPGDDEMETCLVQLRRLDVEMRKSDPAATEILRRRRRHLQDEIARLDRVKRAAETVGGRLDFGALFDELGDRTFLEYGVHDSRVVGVMLRSGRAHRFELGPVHRVETELRQLRFSMRRAARMGRSIEDSQFLALQEQLIGGLRLGDGDLIISPSSNLMAVPWSGFPQLVGRTLSVTPSAALWRRAIHTTVGGTGAMIAGGPDLDVAGDEVERIGAIHLGAKILPPGSTVSEVQKEMTGVAVAHIACHATFSLENPMFSSLRLGDGDLNVYDLERLESPPSVVILSACDSGYTEAGAGVELAGLTSALLSMGTRTVVASVGLVPDAPATSDLMIDFHKGLRSGLQPAAALAAARETAYEDPERFVSAASFICVGA